MSAFAFDQTALSQYCRETKNKANKNQQQKEENIRFISVLSQAHINKQILTTTLKTPASNIILKNLFI